MEKLDLRCPKCGRPMTVKQYRCEPCDLTLEGDFRPSPLARLPLQDQLFVTAFLRTHGNIRKMEKLLKVSYPTVKNRLAGIVAKLDEPFMVADDRGKVLDRLARGEISVDEALDLLG